MTEKKIDYIEHFPKKKSMFSTSKVKRNHKFIWELTGGTRRLDLKSLKNYRNTKSSIKSMHSTSKMKRSRRKNLKIPLKIIKKLPESQINQILFKFRLDDNSFRQKHQE
jgi:succinylglutamate desuccinylase